MKLDDKDNLKGIYGDIVNSYFIDSEGNLSDMAVRIIAFLGLTLSLGIARLVFEKIQRKENENE